MEISIKALTQSGFDSSKKLRYTICFSGVNMMNQRKNPFERLFNLSLDRISYNQQQILMKYLIIFAILCFILKAQSTPGCLNHNGDVVDWWIVYYTPKIIYEHYPLYGYLYTDSTGTEKSFDIYEGFGDEEDGPIGMTINQASSGNLQVVAWNDQLRPEQGAGNSNRAHSKFYMAVTPSHTSGFAVAHSIPEFPSPTSGGLDRNIAIKQKNKAQHSLCMTLNTKTQIESLFEQACFIKPNIYTNTAFGNCPKSSSQDAYKTGSFKIGTTEILAFFKNGDGSKLDIFSTIASEIKSSVVAQTFGSPTAWAPICDTEFTVGNSETLVISSGIKWTQYHDHSKWIYSLDGQYACFGDLNRNTDKQEVRGGAFFCLKDSRVNGALQGINPTHQGC